MIKAFWFRKDLRLDDNRALKEFVSSIGSNDKFLFFYIKNVKNYGNKRISFLLESLSDLDRWLCEFGFKLNIFEGKNLEVIKRLADEFKGIEIYANARVEPYSIKSENEIVSFLETRSCKLRLFQDSTLFSIPEILKNDGKPYTVFTPFKNKALMLIDENHIKECKSAFRKLNKANNLISRRAVKSKQSGSISGGRTAGLKLLRKFCESSIEHYDSSRNIPAERGTSMLSAHLHFGTVSIRECYRASLKKLEKAKCKSGIYSWINELIWREFYYNITYHFPEVINSSFKKKYDAIRWNRDKKSFNAWCEGKTGYPIVDAGMRQLNKEGWMHNRVRMITAMFLTKDLLIDWRWGEKYFASYLIDYDFSSNNGGWQWSASTGCDAQPYFRIFNPNSQSNKFDPDGIYIRKYVEELNTVPSDFIHEPSRMTVEMQKKTGVIIGKDYPFPIVNHSKARLIAINEFRNIIQ